MTKTIADYEKRTIEGLTETDEELLKTEKHKKMRMGRPADPLIHISLENWLPDELHLMLQVTDVLAHNLIVAAACNDYKNGRRSKDILHGPMVKILLKSCGVSRKKHLLLLHWLEVTN